MSVGFVSLIISNNALSSTAFRASTAILQSSLISIELSVYVRAFQGLCINEFRGLHFESKQTFDIQTGEQVHGCRF